MIKRINLRAEESAFCICFIWGYRRKKWTLHETCKCNLCSNTGLVPIPLSEILL